MLKISLAMAAMIIGKIVCAQDDTQIIGNWKGESICQLKNSSCHDEIVVYHISKGKEPATFLVNADKIVDGKPINMGTLDFNYEKENKILVCTIKNGTFKFIITGNKMDGTLITPDRILYRRITLQKVE